MGAALRSQQGSGTECPNRSIIYAGRGVILRRSICGENDISHHHSCRCPPGRDPCESERPHDVLGADDWQRRRGVWRHRNEPALRVPRGGERGHGRRNGHARSRARRALAHPLGADRGGHAEIRAHPAAGGQQGRGGNAHAHGARATCAREWRRRDRALRHHQCGAVLWRRGHHARIVGAVRGRRPQGRDAGLRSLHRATDGRDPRRAICRSIAWHREGGGFLRTDHRGVVHCDRHSRVHIRPQQFGSPAGFQSDLRGRVLGLAWHHWACYPRRSVPRRDRCRGALCRPRSFRPQADPDRVDRFGSAVAGDELSRPRRAGARRSEGDRKSVLSALSQLGLAADGGAGHGCNGDCESGGDHRRLFAEPAGDPARSTAAA